MHRRQRSTVSLSPQSPFSSVLFFPSYPSSHVPLSQLFPSADTVVILDAISLRLVRTLAFSQVFPGIDHASARITSLAVDSALKLVRASYPIMMWFRQCFDLLYLQFVRWSRHPARGLPFGLYRGSLLALGSFTHHSFFLIISMSQPLTVAPVRFPCLFFFVIS